MPLVLTYWVAGWYDIRALPGRQTEVGNGRGQQGERTRLHYGQSSKQEAVTMVAMVHHLPALWQFTKQQAVTMVTMIHHTHGSEPTSRMYPPAFWGVCKSISCNHGYNDT